MKCNHTRDTGKGVLNCINPYNGICEECGEKVINDGVCCANCDNHYYDISPLSMDCRTCFDHDNDYSKKYMNRDRLNEKRICSKYRKSWWKFWIKD